MFATVHCEKTHRNALYPFSHTHTIIGADENADAQCKRALTVRLVFKTIAVCFGKSVAMYRFKATCYQ